MLTHTQNCKAIVLLHLVLGIHWKAVWIKLKQSFTNIKKNKTNQRKIWEIFHEKNFCLVQETQNDVLEWNVRKSFQSQVKIVRIKIHDLNGTLPLSQCLGIKCHFNHHKSRIEMHALVLPINNHVLVWQAHNKHVSNLALMLAK